MLSVEILRGKEIIGLSNSLIHHYLITPKVRMTVKIEWAISTSPAATHFLVYPPSNEITGLAICQSIRHSKKY